MKYEELVKALRCKRDDCEGCGLAFFDNDEGWMCQYAAKDDDAADAIEELDAEETRLLLITSELQDKVVEPEEELNDVDIAADDNARQVEELQAEVERLKDCNDELREAQTYIDHYGDKWLTSAKDVPTSAYNHGYMDGKNEAEQALEPKRGEIVRCKDCKHRPTGTGVNHDIEFPDARCPCQCYEDYWYSWMPSDDWYCGNGEKMEVQE